MEGGAKVNYINMNAHNRPIQGVNPSNAFNTIYSLPRSLNVKEFKSSVDEEGNMIWWDASKNPQENPYWVTKYRQNNDTRNRLLGNVSLKYAPTNWFDIERVAVPTIIRRPKMRKYMPAVTPRPVACIMKVLRHSTKITTASWLPHCKDNLLEPLGRFRDIRR